MEIGFKEKVRCSVKPAVVTAELDAIRARRGMLTPRIVVEEARNPKSPIHECFEWDNDHAAELWRLSQAGYLIRSLVIVKDDAGNKLPTPPRWLVLRPAASKEETTQYVTLTEAMRHKDSRERLLADALAELESFKRKYDSLLELAEVFAAMDRAIAAARAKKARKKR